MRRAELEGLFCYSGAIYWSEPTERSVAAGNRRETRVDGVVWLGSLRRVDCSSSLRRIHGCGQSCSPHHLGLHFCIS